MKLTLPQSWEEVTIRQFTELTRVKDMELEPIELMAQLISILSGAEYSEIEKLSLPSLKKAYQVISFIDKDEFSDKVEPFINIDGIDFKANLDIRRITTGQYIEIKEFTKEPKETPYNIHNIMATLYKPVGKYKDMPHDEVSDIFYEKMSITFAYPVAVFFWNLLNNSMQDIKASLDQEMIQKVMKI